MSETIDKLSLNLNETKVGNTGRMRHFPRKRRNYMLRIKICLSKIDRYVEFKMLCALIGNCLGTPFMKKKKGVKRKKLHMLRKYKILFPHLAGTLATFT